MDLIMPFVGENDDPKYVNGFEAGQIWGLLKSGYVFDNYLFHKDNKKQVSMMCERFLYDYRIEDIDGTWSTLYGNKSARVN